MDRMQILQTLIEREQRRRDEALRDLREAERQAQAAQQQVQSLLDYRSQYHQRWAEQFAKSAPIEIVRCYHGFVERLEQAIATQQMAAAQAGGRQLGAQQRLRLRELKLATVRRLIERRQQTALRQGQRHDQKISDEASQRRAWVQARALATI